MSASRLHLEHVSSSIVPMHAERESGRRRSLGRASCSASRLCRTAPTTIRYSGTDPRVSFTPEATTLTTTALYFRLAPICNIRDVAERSAGGDMSIACEPGVVTIRVKHDLRSESQGNSALHARIMNAARAVYTACQINTGLATQIFPLQDDTSRRAKSTHPFN